MREREHDQCVHNGLQAFQRNIQQASQQLQSTCNGAAQNASRLANLLQGQRLHLVFRQVYRPRSHAPLAVESSALLEFLVQDIEIELKGTQQALFLCRTTPFAAVSLRFARATEGTKKAKKKGKSHNKDSKGAKGMLQPLKSGCANDLPVLTSSEQYLHDRHNAVWQIETRN